MTRGESRSRDDWRVSSGDTEAAPAAEALAGTQLRKCAKWSQRRDAGERGYVEP
jgi:hypothetical protein